MKQTKVYDKNHYSAWRRTLDMYPFKTIDIDAVEIRDGEIKAIIEQTEWEYVQAMLSPDMIINTFKRIYAVQGPVYKQIANALGIPAYLVMNDVDCTTFIVHQFGKVFSDFRIMNTAEYLEFLKFDDVALFEIKDVKRKWIMWRTNIGIDKVDDALNVLRQEHNVDLSSPEHLRLTRNSNGNYQIFWKPTTHKEEQ